MCIICSLRNPTNPMAALDPHLVDKAPSAANTTGLVWQGYGLIGEGADASAGVDTIYEVIVGQSALGSLSQEFDEDWFAVNLQAGVTYDFRLLGFGKDFLSDPFLALMDDTGSLLASDDDSFTSGSTTHELDSALTFTATYTGTYYLVADKFGTSSGDYLITAAPNDPAGMVLTVDEIAWQLLNNGNEYFSSTEGAAFDVSGDRTLTVNLTGLTSSGIFLARKALEVWSAYTGITFSETFGAADITFDDTDTGAFAEAFTSGTEIVSATVNIGRDWLESFGTTLKSYSFETYLHEIGHALGLAHGGNYNGSAVYGTDNFYLNDSIAWSIMSYMAAENDEFDFGGPNDWNTFVDASFRFVYSPMIADMIAMNHLYGKPTAFSGNTTYGYGANTGVTAIDAAVNAGARMAMTVFDTDGTDLLNFSQSSANQTISLLAESLSSVLGGRHNFGIARDSVIENATGGFGNDRLIGNDADNRLNGGGGADTLRGGGGNDTFVVNGSDRIIEFTGAGIDLVSSSVSQTLASNVENLTLTGTGALIGNGNALANILRGNIGSNTLSGRSGNDSLYGGRGNDIISGGLGADRFVFHTAPSASNIDIITDFDPINDRIVLENNVFQGLALGTLSTTAFAANRTGLAGDGSDRVVYETDSGRLFFDRDGTGSITRIQFAVISTDLALTASDFTVI